MSLQEEFDLSYLFISHDMAVVHHVCDRIAVMYNGKIVEVGARDQVIHDPQHPYTIGLMSSIPQLSGPRGRLATVPGMVPTTQNMPEGCRFATRCPFAQPICANEPPLAPLDMRNSAGQLARRVGPASRRYKLVSSPQ